MFLSEEYEYGLLNWKIMIGPLVDTFMTSSILERGIIVTFVLYRCLIENDMSASILASVIIAESNPCQSDRITQ